MKTGQLVELSAYAKKLVMFQKFIGRVGMITNYNNYKGQYDIVWAARGKLIFDSTWTRKDIKKIK